MGDAFVTQHIGHFQQAKPIGVAFQHAVNRGGTGALAHFFDIAADFFTLDDQIFCHAGHPSLP